MIGLQRIIPFLIAIVLLAGLVLLANFLEKRLENTPMVESDNNTTLAGTIPPIDETLPANLETATFALG